MILLLGMHGLTQTDEYLATALNAFSSGLSCHELLDQLPVPVYTTDAQGEVTYWNQACVEFAGRRPQLGQDRWCVTWRIYSMTGEHIPHDQCPMAEAIRKQQPIHDRVAIAERPDGTRVAFHPYPTPLFDERGSLTGAVNVLIDVTEEQSSVLAEQAVRCRRLAGATYDRSTSDALGSMADEFERTAQDLRVARQS